MPLQHLYCQVFQCLAFVQCNNLSYAVLALARLSPLLCILWIIAGCYLSPGLNPFSFVSLNYHYRTLTWPHQLALILDIQLIPERTCTRQRHTHNRGRGAILSVCRCPLSWNMTNCCRSRQCDKQLQAKILAFANARYGKRWAPRGLFNDITFPLGFKSVQLRQHQCAHATLPLLIRLEKEMHLLLLL